MKYKTIYDNLVTTRDKLKRTDEYTEDHHIIPRCLGGSDKKENLVSLTAREHLIAHKLLCKIYPTESKLKIALLYMITSKRYGNNMTSREYEKLREEVSKARIDRITEENCIDFIHTFKVSRFVSAKTRHMFDGNKTPMRWKRFIRALNIYIMNLVEAKKTNSVVHIPRRQSKYVDIKSPVGFSHFMKAETWLVENGFISEVFIDSESPLGLRKRSYVVPSDKILEYFDR